MEVIAPTPRFSKGEVLRRLLYELWRRHQAGEDVGHPYLIGPGWEPPGGKSMTMHSQLSYIRKATVEKFGAGQVLKVSWEGELRFEVLPSSTWQAFEDPEVDFTPIGRGVEPGYIIRATWEDQSPKDCLNCPPLFPAIILWWLLSWGENF